MNFESCVCPLYNLALKLLSQITEVSDVIWIAKLMPNCRPGHWYISRESAVYEASFQLFEYLFILVLGSWCLTVKYWHWSYIVFDRPTVYCVLVFYEYNLYFINYWLSCYAIEVYGSQSCCPTVRSYLQTQCGQGWGLTAYQVSSWSVQLFGHNTAMLQTDRQTGQDNHAIA